ncbi:hypothetical protein LG649_15275 [Tamlana sp. PT2-4]|uniref:Uncharacterized protein n=1 Tax=Neotamlana laminarinivorans TaxID=2883124 RepID=A0A9X1I2Z4_9FLAO|nr:hypothetical protein [Tamlana laminarinivorans]
MIGSEIRIIRIETDDFNSVINKINKIKSKENILIIPNRTRYGIDVKIQGDNLAIENYLTELSLTGIPFN